MLSIAKQFKEFLSKHSYKTDKLCFRLEYNPYSTDKYLSYSLVETNTYGNRMLSFSPKELQEFKDFLNSIEIVEE